VHPLTETGRQGQLEAAVLQEIIRRIVAVAQPERIILFGSAARGESGPDSDLDFLVIKASVDHRRRMAQQIHRTLLGIMVPVDIIVLTPEDIEAFGDQPGSIVAPALREGIVVYAS
jgi:predicted nucleotidyltransferase